MEAKVATLLASLTTWKDSFQSRLEHVEGDMRVQRQSTQQTTGDLQRSMEQTGERLREVEREGGERVKAMDASLKVLCSRMDAADNRHQHMVCVCVCECMRVCDCFKFIHSSVPSTQPLCAVFVTCCYSNRCWR